LVLLAASPFAEAAGLRGKSEHGSLPHRTESGEVGNAGNDAYRVPAALDAAAAAAQGYASAVSGAMLIYEKGSQENALPLTAFLCRR